MSDSSDAGASASKPTLDRAQVRLPDGQIVRAVKLRPDLFLIFELPASNEYRLGDIVCTNVSAEGEVPVVQDFLLRMHRQAGLVRLEDPENTGEALRCLSNSGVWTRVLRPGEILFSGCESARPMEALQRAQIPVLERDDMTAPVPDTQPVATPSELPVLVEGIVPDVAVQPDGVAFLAELDSAIKQHLQPIARKETIETPEGRRQPMIVYGPLARAKISQDEEGLLDVEKREWLAKWAIGVDSPTAWRVLYLLLARYDWSSRITGATDRYGVPLADLLQQIRTARNGELWLHRFLAASQGIEPLRPRRVQIPLGPLGPWPGLETPWPIVDCTDENGVRGSDSFYDDVDALWNEHGEREFKSGAVRVWGKHGRTPIELGDESDTRVFGSLAIARVPPHPTHTDVMSGAWQVFYRPTGESIPDLVRREFDLRNTSVPFDDNADPAAFRDSFRLTHQEVHRVLYLLLTSPINWSKILTTQDRLRAFYLYWMAVERLVPWRIAEFVQQHTPLPPDWQPLVTVSDEEYDAAGWILRINAVSDDDFMRWAKATGENRTINYIENLFGKNPRPIKRLEPALGRTWLPDVVCSPAAGAAYNGTEVEVHAETEVEVHADRVIACEVVQLDEWWDDRFWWSPQSKNAFAQVCGSSRRGEVVLLSDGDPEDSASYFVKTGRQLWVFPAGADVETVRLKMDRAEYERKYGSPSSNSGNSRRRPRTRKLAAEETS